MSAPREWIAKISDPELRERVRKVMTALMILSDAPVASPKLPPTDEIRRGASKPGMRAKGADKHHESSIPKGVRMTDADSCPSKDVSLLEHFTWQFERATTGLRLTVLCEEAENEVKWRKEGLPPNAMALIANYDEDRDKRILFGECEGIPAAVVAVRHSWPEGWVRATRLRNEKEADYGYPRPNWRRLSDAERYDIVEGLRVEEGLTQRETAFRLGISHGSVGNYWNRDKAA